MTDSGQAPNSPPDPQQPAVPDWAPTQPPASTAPPATPDPDPYAVEATMRLIPVQRIPPPTASAPPSPAAPAESTAPAPTERRIGKYIVKRELGRGGMGAVYLAEQPGLGREVAIKELILSAVADPTALKRFMQEAQVMARTSHPNLVQVHDLEQMGDANYIVLEFVRGKSLRDRINQGNLPLPQTFAVMHGVLQALDYAHKHAIVHRDMKPENVLMSEEGDVKVDGRSDLYSAGIMFYELVVGQPPFTASEADGPFTLMAKHVQAPPKPPSVHRPGLDMGLEEVILKSLSKRPEERYQSGQEFDDAMSRIADRLCPGWQRSLLPGADLAKMVPGGTASPTAFPAIPGMPVMPAASSMPAQPVQSVYNPTPPVRPVAKKTSGCLGVIGGALGLLPLLGGLVALYLR